MAKYAGKKNSQTGYHCLTNGEMMSAKVRQNLRGQVSVTHGIPIRDVRHDMVKPCANGRLRYCQLRDVVHVIRKADPVHKGSEWAPSFRRLWSVVNVIVTAAGAPSLDYLDSLRRAIVFRFVGLLLRLVDEFLDLGTVRPDHLREIYC
jgi:hypothetical protein